MSFSPLNIICLCADWCQVCRQYQPVFLDRSWHRSDSHYLWIDIDEHEHLLSAHEIEDFPTLQIQDEQRVLFFGTIEPNIAVLKQLTKNYLKRSSKQPTPFASIPYISLLNFKC